MSLCQPCATKHPPLSCSCFHPLPRPTKTRVRCPILESSSMVPWVAAAQRPLAKLTRATTCNTWILQQKLRQMFFLLNLPPSRWVSEIMSGVHLNCQWFFAYWSMMMIWNTAPGFTPVGPGEICGSTKGRFGVGGLSLSWRGKLNNLAPHDSGGSRRFRASCASRRFRASCASFISFRVLVTCNLGWWELGKFYEDANQCAVHEQWLYPTCFEPNTQPTVSNSAFAE